MRRIQIKFFPLDINLEKTEEYEIKQQEENSFSGPSQNFRNYLKRQKRFIIGSSHPTLATANCLESYQPPLNNCRRSAVVDEAISIPIGGHIRNYLHAHRITFAVLLPIYLSIFWAGMRQRGSLPVHVHHLCSIWPDPRSAEGCVNCPLFFSFTIIATFAPTSSP